MSRNISFLTKTLVVAGVLMAAQPAFAGKHVVKVPELEVGAAGVIAVLVIGGAILLARKRKA